MKFDEVIISPISTEATFQLTEEQNKLAFVVDKRANKTIIREAVEKLFSVKVIKVNTLITHEGKKKAYVRLSDSDSALDIATQFGLF
ncbi:MAG: 50S ribosomal protein L23 [Candidatus Hodarchaeales archaeon]|jgi:large subunit ribosomal protein L23